MISLKLLIFLLITCVIISTLITWLIMFLLKKIWLKKILIEVRGAILVDDYTTDIDDIITGRNFQKKIDKAFNRYFKL